MPTWTQGNPSADNTGSDERHVSKGLQPGMEPISKMTLDPVRMWTPPVDRKTPATRAPIVAPGSSRGAVKRAQAEQRRIEEQEKRQEKFQQEKFRREEVKRKRELLAREREHDRDQWDGNEQYPPLTVSALEWQLKYSSPDGAPGGRVSDAGDDHEATTGLIEATTGLIEANVSDASESTLRPADIGSLRRSRRTYGNTQNTNSKERPDAGTTENQPFWPWYDLDSASQAISKYWGRCAREPRNFIFVAGLLLLVWFLWAEVLPLICQTMTRGIMARTCVMGMCWCFGSCNRGGTRFEIGYVLA